MRRFSDFFGYAALVTMTASAVAGGAYGVYLAYGVGGFFAGCAAAFVLGCVMFLICGITSDL